MSDIRDDVVGLALLAAERVTRKSLSDDDHRRLVEQALDESDLSALSRGG
jgi:F-type H+-transporting ATPase subunit b